MDGFFASRPAERVLARGAVDRGGLEQLPAVEDRLGVDLRRAAAGGLDREGDVGAELRGLVDAPEDRAGDHLGARPQRLEHDVLALEAEDRLEVGCRRSCSPRRPAGAQHAARRRRGRRGRGRDGRTGAPYVGCTARRRAVAPAPWPGRAVASVASGGRRWPALARARGRAVGGRRLGSELAGWAVLLRGLRGRVGRRDLAEMRVGVLVAVGVLEDDVVAEILAGAHPLDEAVVDRDHGRAHARVDVDRPSRRIRLDRHRRVARLDAARRPRLVEVVGVGRVGGDGEVALGQAGQRADERRRACRR